MAVTDDLNAAITALTFNASNNAPINQLIINQLQAVGAEMSAGAPLDELNDAISQLQWAMPNNAPASIPVLSELNDVLSQLTYGSLTTNPDDLAAIGQITTEMLNQEPDWAPLLWINWDGATTLTVQVRDFYTLTMVINAVPWWTNWDSYYDAASNIIATIYLMQMPTS
jgi:hypothetical protein